MTARLTVTPGRGDQTPGLCSWLAYAALRIDGREIAWAYGETARDAARNLARKLLTL